MDDQRRRDDELIAAANRQAAHDHASKRPTLEELSRLSEQHGRPEYADSFRVAAKAAKAEREDELARLVADYEQGMAE